MEFSGWTTVGHAGDGGVSGAVVVDGLQSADGVNKHWIGPRRRGFPAPDLKGRSASSQRDVKDALARITHGKTVGGLVGRGWQANEQRKRQ
jgi:hypothetical protein